MSFIDLAMSRRSIRSFKSEMVSNEDIMKLLKSAIYAPSAGNYQSWQFYVVKDEDVKQKLASSAGNQKFIMSAPVIIVVCADTDKNAGKYGERGKKFYCIQDTAAATQNILLCAADLGLGACWCGAFDDEKVSEALNLNNDIKPVAIIPVGYPNAVPNTPIRKHIEDVVTFIGDGITDIVSESDNTPKYEHMDLYKALFNDVNLCESIFVNIGFYKTDISDANLSESEIHDCNLSGMKIYDCRLDGLQINGVDISEILK